MTAEWLRLPNLNGKQLDQLRALGITFEAEQRAGGIACCRCIVSGTTWRPDPNGELRPILAVWRDGEAPSIFNAVADPEVVDLIALDLRDGRRWWHREGIRNQTPLSWLVGHAA